MSTQWSCQFGSAKVHPGKAVPRRQRRRARRSRFCIEPLERRCLLSAPVVAPNIPITTDPAVQQMPSIAVDPLDANHLVVAYMDRSLVNTGYAGIGVSISRDGGTTWQRTSIPLAAGFDQGAANPITQFDAQGHVFVSFMAATFLGTKPAITNPDFWNSATSDSDRRFGFQSNNGIFVARSDDGGNDWAQPVAVTSHLYAGTDVPFEVVPFMTIDRYAVLPSNQPNSNYGNMYIAWSRMYPNGQWPGHPDNFGGGDIMVAVSIDGGQTWQTRLQNDPVTGVAETVIQDPVNAVAAWPGLGYLDQARLTVGPEGDLYLSDFGAGDFSTRHSTDAGRSFTTPDHVSSDWLAFGPGERTDVNEIGLPTNHFRMHQARAIVADPTRPVSLWH